MLGKDKSALETVKVQDFGSATALLAEWLASLPHRLGARLFAMNDMEAGWRGWEVTELRCGLARSYHDSRFNGWDDAHGWPWDGEG